MRKKSPLWSPGALKIPAATRESMLLESAALSCGFSTTRIGSRAFTADRADGRTIGFDGTLSLGGSRIGVDVWRDRLLRREFLQAAGIPIPRSRRVTLDDSRSLEPLAGGVILKPVRRGAGPLLRSGGSPETALEPQLQHWQANSESGTEFLAEDPIRGQEFHFIVAGGRVVSVIRRRQGRWDREVKDPLHHVHPELLSLTTRALAALPRAGHGVVRMIGPSLTKGAAGWTVVSAGPMVPLLGRGVPPTWSEGMAMTLIQAASAGPGMACDPGQPMTARLRISDVSSTVQLSGAIAEWAREREFGLAAESCESNLLHLEATAPSQELALLSGLLIRGRLADQRPALVRISITGSSCSSPQKRDASTVSEGRPSGDRYGCH